MGSYYQHPFRNFDSASHTASNASSEPASNSSSTDSSSSNVGASSGGGADDSSEKGNPIFALLFQGSNAKYSIPALFIAFSACYLFIYDSMTAYSSGAGLMGRQKGRGVASRDSYEDEELSDRAFESSKQSGNWRPPSEDDGPRSVEEARSRAGFFGRLFCGGLKRSRWCN